MEREPLKKIINSIKGYLMKKIQSVKVKQLGGDWLESQPKKGCNLKKVQYYTTSSFLLSHS